MNNSAMVTVQRRDKNVSPSPHPLISCSAWFFTFQTPWAHLDIAGPVWKDDMGGATGYGVKLLTKWVQNQGA